MIAFALFVLSHAETMPPPNSEKSCHEYAQSRFGDNEQTEEIENGVVSLRNYRSHYKNSTKTCYIYVRWTEDSDPGLIEEDIFIYGDGGPISRLRRGGPRGPICVIENNTKCNSREEFESYINTLMASE